jgi:hypothetical protein
MAPQEELYTIEFYSPAIVCDSLATVASNMIDIKDIKDWRNSKRGKILIVWDNILSP